MLKNGKRLVAVHEKGSLSRNKIIIDTKTEENYFYVCKGDTSGLNPLLDENGKVIVRKIILYL